ncbi:MAG: outer membrane autotransporter barrel domain-containing protein [Rhodospirillaceae bacterium]|nr:MAG: outer membrane autotransporter barrel domain-containing protein [Rhodospirillaceae bacterium]
MIRVLNTATTDLDALVVTSSANLANGKILLVDSAIIDLQHDTTTEADTKILTIKVVYKTTPDGVTGDEAPFLFAGLTAADATDDDILFQAILNACDGTSPAACAKMGKQIGGTDAAPGGGAAPVIASISTQTANIMGTRMASLREGANYAAGEATGFASGGGGLNKSVWIRPYTYHGDQGARSGKASSDSATYGFVAGVDAMVLNAVRVGVAAGYANTDVDVADVRNTNTDIDSWQVSLYGDYTADRWYVDGVIGYGRNNVDTVGTIAIPATAGPPATAAVNGTVSGDYDTDQFTLQLGGAACRST